MTISIYILTSEKNRDNAKKYASWLIKNMAMLPEAKEYRFVLRSNIFPLFFRRKNSIAVIYDISHDFFPEIYSKFHRNYMRFITKYALHLAQKIVVPSESAKNDILKFYPSKKQINSEKIFVAYHRIDNQGDRLSPRKTLGVRAGMVPSEARRARTDTERDFSRWEKSRVFSCDNLSSDEPYFLYVGRLELKKNILGILRAFDLFKAQYKSQYKLVLAGEPGFGNDKIKETATRCNFKNDIILIDSPDGNKTENLFKNADIFFYPSFYESSGGTILKAQFYGLPVITSCISSMPEIAGQGAVLVNSHDIEEMKEAMIRVVVDENLREYLSQKSLENLKRFSWQSCAKQTLDIILK